MSSRSDAGGNPIRLLLVDDHQIVTEGLKYTLELEPDLEVVGQAETGDQALKLVQQLRPDLVLLDLKLRGETGADVCRRIRQADPDAAVVILTTYMEEESLVECIMAGARGYVIKDVELDELKRIIRRVASGQSVLDPQITAQVMQHVQGREQKREQEARLTARQREVLQRVVAGETNKQIAQTLYLSESTVKYHVRQAMDLLGVERRTELVAELMRRGLVS
ncbi:MAG: two-component system response regulator MnoR [Thermoleophilia bacterium]